MTDPYWDWVDRSDRPERPERGERPERPPGSDGRSLQRIAALFEGTTTNDYYYMVWFGDGRVQSISSNAPAGLQRPTNAVTSDWFITRTRGEFREMIRATATDRTVLTGRSIADELAGLSRLRWWLILAGGGVLALGLAGGWWVAERTIQPIQQISNTASRIANGDLSQRINVDDTQNELGRLALVLNSTFARLEAAFSQQARFTADAAHELRTPISVILTHVQNGLSESCDCPEHQAAFHACQRASQRMRRLTDSLLDLSRIDAEQETHPLEPFDLTATVEDCVELIRPLAESKGIQLEIELIPATVHGNPLRIAQVFTNLLSNAIHYNREQGSIRVSIVRDAHHHSVHVADTGIGISPEDLPHVFERFYRADKSRSRAEGRTGLGLAICQAIVAAHQGEIVASSEPGKGSTFTVRLPLPQA